jgi:hypothetical protein
MPDSQLTLLSLLSIKQRREMRVRKEIARLDQQGEALEQHKESLLHQRRDLWEEWRNYSNKEQILESQQLRLFRSQLAEYYQRDHDLFAEMEAIELKHNELQTEKNEQQQRLRQLLLAQDKLRLMME